ncbi:MAG: hypothetical protein ACRD8W_29795, partial [Nitrososphaeraceae archaeon]
MKTSSRRISKVSLLGFSVGFLFLSISLSIAISPHSVEKLVVAQEQSSSSGASSVREEISKDVKDEITLLPKYSPDSVSQT